MKTGIHLALIIALPLSFLSQARGQTKTIEWSTFSMGYDVSSSTKHVIKSVMGQNFIDTSQQSSLHVSSGFLTDTLLQILTFTSTLSVSDAWNLLSLPVSPNSSLKTFLFPTAASSAFAYSGNYVTRDTLERGIGYWLKFRSNETINFLGETLFSDTIEVNTRWNMIGSISIPVAVKDLQSIPASLVVSNFFLYDPGTNYRIADSITPGRGYWVKANQAGYLVLNPPSKIASESRVKIVSDGDVPPPPPEEVQVRDVPKEYALLQNYPNPFNPSTTIIYQLPADSRVRVRVYDVLGQEVRTLVDDVKKAGTWSVQWSPDAVGISVASGIYFYKIETASLINYGRFYSSVKKMLYLK